MQHLLPSGNAEALGKRCMRRVLDFLPCPDLVNILAICRVMGNHSSTKSNVAALFLLVRHRVPVLGIRSMSGFHGCETVSRVDLGALVGISGLYAVGTASRILCSAFFRRARCPGCPDYLKLYRLPCGHCTCGCRISPCPSCGKHIYIESDIRTLSMDEDPCTILTAPAQHCSEADALALERRVADEDDIGLPDVRCPHAQSAEYCAQCGSEDPHGYSDNFGVFYCDYCWKCWNGMVLEDVEREALKQRYPKTLKYHDIKVLQLDKPFHVGTVRKDARIEVSDVDCLDAARFLSDISEPVVLCSASRRAPGGSAGPAGYTQLGEICRSTTFQKVVGQQNFPLGRNTALYVPGVAVFRVEGKPVAQFQVAIVAAPPIELSKSKPEQELQEWLNSDGYKSDLVARVRGILQICASHGHQTVVLGAWGCGVRRHPAHHVADAFRLALDELQSNHIFFHRVIFAIKRDQTALHAFRETFCGKDTLNYGISKDSSGEGRGAKASIPSPRAA